MLSLVYACRELRSATTLRYFRFPDAWLFLSYYQNDEIQETLASNNSLEVTARVNHWKWRSGFVAPSIRIVSLQAQNKIPCPLLQALGPCSCDQEPGWLYSLPSCCPSLPMFCSSDTGLFAVPLTRVHPPAQGLSFCFSAHNALLQTPTWFRKGELSFDLPMSSELSSHSLSPTMLFLHLSLILVHV